MSRLNHAVLLSLLTIIIPLAPSIAKGQGVLREIVNRMDRHYKSLQTLQADIERSSLNSQLGETDRFKGRFVMRRGQGKEPSLRIDWEKPQEVASIVNGRFILHRPRLNRAYFGKLDSNEFSRSAFGALRSLILSGTDVRTNYLLTYLAEEVLKDGTKAFHIRLQQKIKPTYKIVDLWVDANGMPRQAKITGLENDIDTLFLSNVRKNATINGAIFNICFSPGIEVMPL